MNLISRAETYRADHNLYKNAGVVVFNGTEPQSWVDDLRDPHHWQPGCIAVDGQGQHWIATGGNKRDGAKRWEFNGRKREL